MNRIDIKRMLELEELAKEKIEYANFSIEELKYIELAEKMPFNYMVAFIECYKRNFFIDKKQIMKTLEVLFHCTEYEFDVRFKNVQRILKYKNKELDNLVDEQKKMVKSLRI
ncbi:MAG: hypothetical protein IJ068_01725 [Bacilli bacterium]|nr:hypothetical protein [Bacilli bacterium]